MNTLCPNEDRLKSLICEAFDEISGADAARLEKIGSQLSKRAHCNKPQRSKIRHWLFWLLLGTSMTAVAWWTGKSFYKLEQPSVVIESSSGLAAPALPKQESITSTPVQKDQQNKHQPDADKDSSVIYKRELY